MASLPGSWGCWRRPWCGMASGASQVKRKTRKQDRRVVRLAAALAAAALVGAAPAPPLSVGSLDDLIVTLEPTGPTKVAQGRSFGFRATVRNPDPSPVSGSLLFELDSLDGTETTVAFRKWSFSAPAGGAQFVDVEVPTAQWFVSRGAFRIDAELDSLPVGDPLGFDVTSPTVAVPAFLDATDEAGLDTTLPASGCGVQTAGAAWGDIEGDGDLDLFVPVRGGASQLWVNDGTGRFTDHAATLGIDLSVSDNMSAIFVDHDNDGDPDLFAVSHQQANQLYVNDGSGTFVDRAAEAGVAATTAGATASWGDYDADGDLDLYVTNNFSCAEEKAPEPDRLYRNEGDGTFSDQTHLLPEEATAGAGFQAVWFDYDGDGDEDLYLGNDYFGPRRDHNHLWRNDGPGPGDSWTFTDVTEESGTAFYANTMGIAVGDVDRDLDLDFAISNIAGNVLARNNGDGTFTDDAGERRVQRVYQHAGRTSITWGLGFYDLNLDRWEDLYVAAGSLSGPLDQPNQMFVSARDGTFLDLSVPSGMADPAVSRGLSFADFDRDGDIDIYQLNQAGRPTLWRNVTPTRGAHWLEIDTIGTIGNRDGCGALLTLTVSAERLMRPVLCGSSLGAGSDTVVHFGLGSATRASKLIIDWPSGTRQVLRNLRADRLIEVIEPDAHRG
jgi:enediyne biosynthesis protein E4